MATHSSVLPDPYVFVAFDDYGGRLSRHRDHIGEVGCGPGTKTICGRPQHRHGYELQSTEPDANFFCRTCRKAAKRLGLLTDEQLGLAAEGGSDHVE